MIIFAAEFCFLTTLFAAIVFVKRIIFHVTFPCTYVTAVEANIATVRTRNIFRSIAASNFYVMITSRKLGFLWELAFES